MKDIDSLKQAFEEKAEIDAAQKPGCATCAHGEKLRKEIVYHDWSMIPSIPEDSYCIGCNVMGYVTDDLESPSDYPKWQPITYSS